MDNQDHGKNHTTGHENHGPHVCHNCGWHFPNPHPSAKQRRAHKKICGTLEGFKRTDAEHKTHLDVAAEDQLSDEDYKSSGNSELGELKSNKNVKNGGIHRSNSSRSDEDEFSDAVGEFMNTGTSPTIEMVVAKGAQPPYVIVNADIIQEPEHPMQVSQIQNSQGLERSVDNLKNNEHFQNDTSSSTISSVLASSEKKTEALAIDATEGRHDSANLILDVEPEEPVNVITEITSTQPGNDLTDISMMQSGKSSEGQHGNSDADGLLPHMILSTSKPESVVVSEIHSKVEQMNDFAGVTTDVSTTRTNDSVPVDRLVDSKEEQSNFSEPVTIRIDSSPNSCSGPMEVFDIEHMSTLTNSVSDASGPEVDIMYSSENVDAQKVKAEPNEKVAALLIPNVIPAESLSDMTSKDCIDHGPETTSGHDKVIKEMEDHPKNLASVDDDSSLLRSESDEGDVCSAQRVLEENREKQGIESTSIVEERCIERKTDTSECKVETSPDDGSNGPEALPDALDKTCTHRDQTQKGYSNEKQEILPERLIHEAGGAAIVSPADNEVDGASNAISSSNFQDEATTRTANGSDRSGALPDFLSNDVTSTHTGPTQTVCSIEKQEPYDSHHDLSWEIPPEKPTVIYESGIVSMVSPADTEVDEASDEFFLEKATISTGNRSNGLEALPDSEILPEKPKVISESGADAIVCPAHCKVDGANLSFSSSDDFPEKARTDNSNLSGKYVGEGVVEVSRGENLLEVPMWVDISRCTDYSSVTKLENQAENGDTNIRVSEHLHEDMKVDQDNSGLFQSGAENLSLDKQALSSGSWVPSSVAVEDNNADDLSGDVNDINSQSLQEHGDHNLKHQLGTSSSAVVCREFSVKSDGQTDHMEGYSESVSEGKVPSTTKTTNEQATYSTGTLQMPNIHAEETDLKRTLAEESTTGYDKCDMKSESLQEVAVASTTNARDKLLILAADTLQASSEVQAQKAALKKTLGEGSTTKNFGKDTFEIKSQFLPDAVNNLLKQQPSVVPSDASVDSSSQTDSVEGCWGSVSDGTFPSTRDANEERAIIATETLDTTIKDKDQRANLETKIGASERKSPGHSDIFDAPSFMTLVEPGNRGMDQQTVSSEIQTAQNTQQPNSSSLEAGWFPSLTHDVKESLGRKKNEAIIAKVSNWSVGKPHMPLKSRLVEANLESKPKAPHPQITVATPSPKHEASAQDNHLPAKASSPPVTAPEESTAFVAKGDEDKEWNTTARLPENKKEKRKTRGNWVRFVCCTSVDVDP